MALETGEYIGNLVATNPTPADPKSQGDDHLRLIKSTLQNSFAGIEGMILVSGVESGTGNAYSVALTGAPTAPTAYTQNMVVLFQATHANTGNCTLSVGGIAAAPLLDVNGNQLAANAILNGTIISAAYVGASFYVVSPAGMAELTSPAFVGTPTAPTPSVGDNSTKIATTAFAVQLAFAAALPAQTGNAGKFITTNGAVASWQYPELSTGITITASTTLTGANESTFINVAMTSASQSITMMSEAALLVGPPIIGFKNTGNYSCFIRGSTGALIAVLQPFNAAILRLTNSTTPSWCVEFSANSNSTLSTLISTSAYTGTGAGYSIDVCMLSATLGILGYLETGTTIGFVAFTLDSVGNITSMGALNTLSVSTSNEPIIMSALTSSTCAVLTANDAPQVVVLSVSGTTITIGTPLLIAGATTGRIGQDMVVLSPTSFMAFAAGSGSGKLAAQIFSVSGTTLTAGSSWSQAYTAGTSGAAICAQSASNVVAFYPNSSNALVAVQFAVSGNTFTTPVSTVLGYTVVGNITCAFNVTSTDMRIAATGAIVSANCSGTPVLNGTAAFPANSQYLNGHSAYYDGTGVVAYVGNTVQKYILNGYSITTEVTPLTVPLGTSAGADTQIHPIPGTRKGIAVYSASANYATISTFELGLQ